MKKGVFIFWSLLIATAVIRLVFSYSIDVPNVGTCLKEVVFGIGEIVEEPERRENGQVFILRARELFLGKNTDNNSQEMCARDTLIRIKTPLYPRFVYGDRISFQGRLSKPFNFRSDDGRKFNYEGYLAKDHVFYEIKSGKAEYISSGSRGITSTLYSLKRNFVTNLKRVLGEPHAALAAGLVVGEKSALGAELIDDFRTVGLIHIVVLSGYNITIVADAIRRMLSFLPRIWGIVAGGVGIAMFGMLVGGGATVVRSCFMSGVALSADLVRRDYSVHRGLFLAGLIMLIHNPLILLNDPSFQLSFLATFGLTVLSGPIEERLGFITDKFGMRSIVASSLATQIFVSPYLVYMMGSISIVGFISNIIVLPFVPLTMLFVFLTGMGGFVLPQISEFFGWLAHVLLSYELLIVEYSANIPFASIKVPVFSGWVIVVIYLVYAGIFFANRKRFSIFSQLRLIKKSSM